MKYIYLNICILLIIWISISCKKLVALPDMDTLTDLINETIIQDSFNLNVPVSTFLIDYYLYNIQIDTTRYSDENPPPPPPPRFYNKDGEEPIIFVHIKGDMKLVFDYSISDKDSIFIIDQINRNKKIVLDSNKISNIICARNIPHIDFTKYWRDRIYFFFLPILNYDRNLAIVSYDHHCASCGYGKMVYFKKVENRWVLIESFTTWRN